MISCVSAGCWAERTEVHKAASLGQVSELQNLIRSGASVNVVAVDSITPLHEACVRGQAQCVQLLLDAGAQVRPEPWFEHTPIHPMTPSPLPSHHRLLMDVNFVTVSLKCCSVNRR